VPRLLLLLPSATYRAADFLRAAAALGVEVVVGSEERQAMADSMGDRAAIVPLGDPAGALEAIVDLHARAPLDAVVAVDDQGVVVAAQAGEQLGLVHNPPDAVVATRDKAAMRRRLRAAGVLQPAYGVLGPGDDAGVLAGLVGWPSVIKPVSLSASQGVVRVDDVTSALAAVGRVRAILAAAGKDPAGPLLVEEFVAGPEFAVEGLLSGGRLRVLAVFDKPDPLDGPYFEETLYVTPSRLAAPALAAIERTTAAAAEALGLREGPLHAEMRLRPDGAVVVLELAARSIGGLCGRSLRFGLGMSLEELILRHALGLDVDALARREAAAAGVMMLPIPSAGVLEAVRGQEEARAVPGVVGLEVSIMRGRPVRPLPEGDRYLGFLFARGSTPAEVEQALRTAYAHLVVVIAPGS
jgi:biotin carboxylase